MIDLLIDWAVLGFSRSLWDLVPSPGIKPKHPAWRVESQPLDHQGSPYLITVLFSDSSMVPGTEQKLNNTFLKIEV